ncbi:hypothetical protein KC363_g6558 [Hortaea werneckii]|uniref:INO80 complex subunit B-like conserved region domain-containing protein n=1 Tax=Hortaea werneckii TaxID=91943 RepID=A0A3M7G3W8_HORWE|nr:hypothetical protein KC363_g6558 [Hortaea werneckii]RMY95859.1 hypothetical protein D0861_00490 [Hortaea werneckii]
MPPARRSTRAVTSTAATRVAPYATASNSRTNTRYTSSASPGPSPASASLDRTANSKLRLTVKAPPSKLRQATSSAQADSISANADTSESDATPVPASGMQGGSKDGNGRSNRSTRNPRAVIDPDSEEPDDDEDEDMEDVGAVNEELLANEDSEEDAEGEEDEEEDELSGGHPPPPVIKQTGSKGGNGKPGVVVTAPPEGQPKSVEAKEVDEESGMEDDEELSELEEEEEEEEEEEMGNDLEDLEEDEEEALSDEDEGGSRAGTPDLSKLTRRQRGAFEEVESNGLMALSNEAQKKKHLTAEENAMRRAEMARRRKNLSEKRNEEEKMDTINKLLNKPAPKRRTRAEIIRDQQIELMAAAGGGTPGTEEGEEERADPLFTRYIQRANGSRVLAVPEEWREGISGVGGSQVLFMKGQDAKDAGMSSNCTNMASGRMVEEVA